MYANNSSFEANLTHTLREVSFSSYLNKADENMVRKLANDHKYRMKPEEEEEDEEIGVFGAEKYFKGEIEEKGNKNDLRFIDANDPSRKMDQKDHKVEEFDHNFPPKLRGDRTRMCTPSVRSNASCNSRSGLLSHAKQPPEKIENGSKTRTFLARFGCDCMNRKSTQINEKKIIYSKHKTFDSDQKTDQLSSKMEEKKTRNEYFSFPVLNLTDPNSNSNSKSRNLAGKVVKVDNNNGSLSLGKKLSLLNNLEDEMYNSSSRMYNNDNDNDNDIDSESSSDLFEIESFSPTGDSSCLGQRKSNYYAPSEVSIEWSVVTASAADFSVVSDYEDVRTGGGGGGGFRNKNVGGNNARCTDKKEEQKKRAGILSGCTSHKAVRVAGDGYKVSGGGVGGRRRLSDSSVVGGMFRGG